MKLKTRSRITCFTMIVLPLVLSIFTFLVIGATYVNKNIRYGVPGRYETVVESFSSMGESTQDTYNEIVSLAEKGDECLLDNSFLDDLNTQLKDISAFIIVRKGDKLFYAGNDMAAEKIFNRLPDYESIDADDGAGVFYRDLNLYVLPVDFKSADGQLCTIFIVSITNNSVVKQLVIDMCVAIFVILVFTALTLTLWMNKSVFEPINELNVAMTKIKDGNFDYVLDTYNKGEIGELYRNYEDMRLRLKESTEEKLAHEAQNRELISNISHDLKTPITAVKGYVEGIMDGVADTPEKMDKYIRTIYNKANDMDRLINELTIYSKIDNNRIPYNFHRINVAEYFGDCVEEVGMDLESKNIRLNYSNIVGPDTKVIADPEQMKRVINNIIGNSVKYMDKKEGVIDIRILDEVDSIRVEIEDNGKGISQKDIPNIFDRFYRTDSSRNSAQGGSGIGLSIVKKIIEDHGGYIWATGKEGEGTCIHFVLRKYNEAKGDNI